MAAGCAVGLAFGALHALLVVQLNADQIVSGLGITLFASGVSAFLGPLWITWKSRPDFIDAISSTVLRGILGCAPTTHLALGVGVLAAWALSRRRPGLAIRAVGDAPEAARALGVRVAAVRWRCVLAGGLLAGAAGATLSLAYSQTWTSTMPNGLGWIVIALVPLAKWRPGRVILFCLLLAGVSALQVRFQLIGVRVAPSLLEMIPYAATLIAVVAGRLHPVWRAPWSEPATLGRPLD
jgi:simple sugar transport system permease protein